MFLKKMFMLLISAAFYVSSSLGSGSDILAQSAYGAG